MLAGMEGGYGWPVPESRRWRVSGQIAGAALLGAIVAAVVLAIWHNSLRVESRSCSNPLVDLCLGPAFGGLIAGAAVVLLGPPSAWAMPKAIRHAVQSGQHRIGLEAHQFLQRGDSFLGRGES